MAKNKRAPFRSTPASIARYFCAHCGRETLDDVLNRTAKIVMYSAHGSNLVWVAHAACWREFVAALEKSSG